MRTVRRLIAHPLFVLLPVQAVLLFWRLDRLPAWGDEEMTRRVCAASWPEALQLLANDIHPPLYFSIARAWLRLPWTVDPIIALRALSAVAALITGAVVYALWVARHGRAARWWFAALWATSPFLLLYGRMARSYTLQMLLGALVVAAAERLVRYGSTSTQPPAAALGDDRGFSAAPLAPLMAYVGAATLLLYTHYLPGIALIAAVAAVLGWRLAIERRPVLLIPLLAPPLAIAAAYAPWLPHLWIAAARLATPTSYALTPSPLLDRVVGLAYAFIAFSFGETLPTWSVAALIVVAPLVAWLVVAGCAARPAWLAPVGIAALLAFAAASRWVSYAFITARLSFAYPFWLLLLVFGIARRPRLGRAAGGAVLLIALAAIGSYVRLENFLNKAYVVPVEAIAARIADSGEGAGTVVLVDPHGAQLDVSLRRRLPEALTVFELRDDTAAAARQRVLDPSARTVWIIRSAVDRSPDRWVSAFETALAEQYERRDHFYVPYSALDQMAMRLAGWRERPTHVIDVIELRRRD